MNAAELMGLMTRKEQLCSELLPYVEDRPVLGKILHHPLIVEFPINLECCAAVNVRFNEKNRMLQEAEDTEDWRTYIWLHERPYRIQALYFIEAEIGNKEFWELFADVWMDTENQFQYYNQLEELLKSGRPDKEFLMSEEEREFLKALPETGIQIYRGFHIPEKRFGMSWTLDLEKAKWFAKRLPRASDTPEVIAGLVDKKFIHAYFDGRNESEILVFHDDVRNKRNVEV